MVAEGLCLIECEILAFTNLLWIAHLKNDSAFMEHGCIVLTREPVLENDDRVET